VSKHSQRIFQNVPAKILLQIAKMDPSWTIPRKGEECQRRTTSQQHSVSMRLPLLNRDVIQKRIINSATSEMTPPRDM